MCAEVSGFLVGPPVFKTGEAEHLGLAGSIPVHLRQAFSSRSGGAADVADRPAPAHPAHRRPAGAARPRGGRGPARRDAWSRVPSRPRRSGLARGEIAPEEVAQAAEAALPTRATALRPLINATGVVVHTNIGRAPLSQAAIEALTAAAGYVDVEFDVETGARARRGRGDAGCPARGRARRGRRARGQQRRRGPRPRDHRPGGRAGGGRQPRRDGGDRRRLPAAGPDRLDGRPAARGGDDQPDDAEGLRRRGRSGDRLHPQGPPEQLPGRGVHLGGRPRGAGDPGRARRHGHRQRAAAPRPAPARRARRHDGAAARGDRRDRQRRQAPRRSAGRARAGRGGRGRAASEAPAGPGAAGRQADPRRAGGDGPRTAGLRSRHTSTPTRARCARAPRPWRASWAVGWSRRPVPSAAGERPASSCPAARWSCRTGVRRCCAAATRGWWRGWSAGAAWSISAVSQPSPTPRS